MTPIPDPTPEAPRAVARVTTTHTVTETHSVASVRNACYLLQKPPARLPAWLAKKMHAPIPAMIVIDGRRQVCVVNEFAADDDGDINVVLLSPHGPLGAWVKAVDLEEPSAAHLDARFIPYGGHTSDEAPE
jgi:hypothetical protein